MKSCRVGVSKETLNEEVFLNDTESRKPFPKGRGFHPPSSESWKYSFAGFTILEVKFHRRIPAWFHRIIQVHNLRRVSFSKFCKGMEATGQVVDLS
ncbi:MAG: VTC domain-containing protein [Nitrospina sp.]|nr:VTC domain-containing protein [Nitrospina sp.]